MTRSRAMPRRNAREGRQGDGNTILLIPFSSLRMAKIGGQSACAICGHWRLAEKRASAVLRRHVRFRPLVVVGRMVKMARRMPAVPSVIGRFAPKGEAHRQPRCRGSVRCFPALYGRAKADRRADCRCAYRSTRPSFGGDCEFRRAPDPTRSEPPRCRGDVARGDMVARPAAAREEPVVLTRTSLSKPGGKRFPG